jgi:hypothetical protein
MTSPSLSESFGAPASMSQILIVKSPDADARTFSAAGLKSTCPTFFGCPLSLPTGATSLTSSAGKSLCSVKPSGTRHRKTLPSSDPEAMRESLKGFQSVSNTTAVWPLNSGNRSGSLPLSLTGRTAKAPPPLASQFTAMYSGLALTRLVSQAFLDIRKLS